jgi:flagellar motor switch protein FliG
MAHRTTKILMTALLLVLALFAKPTNTHALPAGAEKLRIATIQEVTKTVNAKLSRYCGEGCELVKVEVGVKEEASEETELGFEGIAGPTAAAVAYAENAVVEIQVDQSITSANKERLKAILLNHLSGFATTAEVIWHPVYMPSIGKASSTIDALKRQLEARLTTTVNQTIQTYCPSDCILSFINIRGALITPDEAMEVPSTQQYSSEDSQTVMRIDDINIQVTMNEAISSDRRAKITDILQAKTRYATPVVINVIATPFPETYAEKQGLTEDPYGLEKLRRMLVMFRDLAGTKEIITNSRSEIASTESAMTSSNNNNTNESNSTLKSDNQSSTMATNSNNSALTTSEKQSLESNSSSSERGETISSEETSITDNWMFWGGIGLGLLFIMILAIRYLGAQKDAKIMMQEAERSQSNSRGNDQQGYGAPVMAAGGQMMMNGAVAGGAPIIVKSEDVALRLKVENLKDEMLGNIMREPKVSKETFTRMLKDDGVEQTAKYLHIFGHLIIMELFEDTNLSRDLYALSEYFHKSRFSLTLQDEFDLLSDLKTKFTASEIRVLSSKSSNKFEFLNRLDPAQIHNLIAEEKSQVQSIVLTQLDKKRRMAVFDMYQGNNKVGLMTELSRADAIPRDYMQNVAKALSRKVHARPEFDTENLRSSDIILDLLERNGLNEQIEILAGIQQSNPDTARGLLMKLVTVEILPYLKDGHLLELILGLEREDLVTFLAGTRDHIRSLLLNKAPAELAASWIEDLQVMGMVNDQNYRLVEMKIFVRIRNLAENGVINLLDINSMIYQIDRRGGESNHSMMGQGFSRSAMVA